MKDLKTYFAQELSAPRTMDGVYLKEDVDEVIEELQKQIKDAYYEGWYDSKHSSNGVCNVGWNASETKRELEEIDFNPDCTRGVHDL